MATSATTAFANLRLATRAENSRNVGRKKTSTSGHKGVVWSEKEQAWVAKITVNRKDIRLGHGQDREELAALYREAAMKHHKEFARF